MRKYQFCCTLLFHCSFHLAHWLQITISIWNQKNRQKKLSPSVNTKSWYFSWGYNKDYWTNSDIHISQPGLNNHFTLSNVAATDYPGWNTGIFNKDLMDPQYNIRIGHFLNSAHTWAVELSFDHTKYNINPYQVVQVAGKINGQPINENVALTPQYFSYALHNGANELMVNVVRRRPMINFPRLRLELAGVAKVGMGMMLPHPENTILDEPVNVGPKSGSNLIGWNHGWWQVGGWTAGVEAGFQLTFHRSVYLEITDKEAYTDLSGIQVYDGTANQTMWLNEVISSLGVII